MNVPEQKPEAAASAPSGGTPELEIRILSSLPDLYACVGLQREIWGGGFTEVVPASLLKINCEVGGVTAGAFTESGELVGFVYGITGLRAGRPSHWSHMLGVRESHRGLGIGFRLKHFQRDRLLELGVEEMRWTFDPLVAGNAHFNVNLLGAGVEAYLVDAYGETGSGIHTLGTDRLVARWVLVEEGDVHRRREAAVDRASAAPVGSSGGGTLDQGRAERLRIAVPRDILSLTRNDPEEASGWHRSIREAFQVALREGYRVVGFARPSGTSPGHYILDGPGGQGAKAPR